MKSFKLILTFILFFSSLSFAGISGNSGLGTKRNDPNNPNGRQVTKRVFITEQICDGLHDSCRTHTYPVIPAEEMNDPNKVPYCFNYNRAKSEPCMMFYVYPGGS